MYITTCNRYVTDVTTRKWFEKIVITCIYKQPIDLLAYITIE